MARPVTGCGTRAGYERHRRAGKPACPECLQAHAEYQRRWKEARRLAAGIPARQPAACGTPSGYSRHLRRGEKACPECRAAASAQHRAWEARNRDRINARQRQRRRSDPLFRAAELAYHRGYRAGMRRVR